LEAGAVDRPVVDIRPITARGGSEIFIYSRNRDNLFARTTAALDQMGLSVMDARVMTTSDGMVVNSYQVLDQGGTLLNNPARLSEVREQLAARLTEPSQARIQVTRAPSRRHRHFPIETRVCFSVDEPNQRTIMRLTTLDRPGLLAEVGAVFEQCGIRLQNAKIATVGAEVDDVFFITTAEETPITCEQVLSCLRREIHDRLEASHSV